MPAYVAVLTRIGALVLTTKLLLIVTRSAPGSSVPVTVKGLLTVIAESNVTVLLAFIVSFLKVVAPLIDCVGPAKVTWALLFVAS